MTESNDITELRDFAKQKAEWRARDREKPHGIVLVSLVENSGQQSFDPTELRIPLNEEAD